MSRDKGMLSKQAGEADTGIATLRAPNGKMVSGSKGKREVVVERHRKQATPQRTKSSTPNSRRE